MYYYNRELDLSTGTKHQIEIRQAGQTDYQLTTKRAINNKLLLCSEQEISALLIPQLKVDEKKDSENFFTGDQVREFFKAAVDQNKLCQYFGEILSREYCRIARLEPGAFIDTQIIMSRHTKIIHVTQYYPIIDVVSDFKDIGEHFVWSCGRWDHLPQDDIYLLNDIRETSQFSSFFSRKKGYWPKKMKKWKEKLLVQKPIFLISSY